MIFNTIIKGKGGESGVPIEVAELPEATADTVGKVFLNTTDGSYYVGTGGTLAVGEPMPSRINYDKNIVPEIVGNEAFDGMAVFLIAGDGGIMVYPESIMGADILAYVSEASMIPLYVNSTSMSVEEFNANIGPMFGVSITAFGWQGDGTIDTSDLAGTTVEFINDAQGIFSALPTLILTNYDEINALISEKSSLETQVTTLTSEKASLETQVSTLTNEKQKLNQTIEGLTLVNKIIPDDFKVRSNHRTYAYAGCSFSTIPFEEGFAGPIKQGAFYHCVHLEDFTIAEGVTEIQEYAFESCYNINSIVFPSTLTSIYSRAFYDTYPKATRLTFLSTTPPSILGSDDVFCFAKDDCAIYVPADSVDAYKAAAHFFNRAVYIQADPNTIATVTVNYTVDGHDHGVMGDTAPETVAYGSDFAFQVDCEQGYAVDTSSIIVTGATLAYTQTVYEPDGVTVVPESLFLAFTDVTGDVTINMTLRQY